MSNPIIVTPITLTPFPSVYPENSHFIILGTGLRNQECLNASGWTYEDFRDPKNPMNIIRKTIRPYRHPVHGLGFKFIYRYKDMSNLTHVYFFHKTPLLLQELYAAKLKSRKPKRKRSK